jgi:nicotinate-nucleotide adenylyltransferase
MTQAATPAVRRIGVYGGAFDPPHNAHVAVARAAVAQLALDALHVVPTGQAWHKTRVLSAPAHRLAMARLAFDSLPRTQVDAQELQRTGPSYTIDTVEALQAEHPGAQLMLVLGEDQVRALPTWQRGEDVLKLAIICIAARAVKSPASSALDAPIISGKAVRLIELPPMVESSTEIRSLVAQGRPIDHLVPGAIARYIAKHQLYQTIA